MFKIIYSKLRNTWPGAIPSFRSSCRFGKQETLAGVNIRLKGTTTGTATDLDGNFTFNVPSANAVMQFPFLGYTPKEVRVRNTTTFNVTHDPDLSSLSEVVVVGYGTQERAKVTSKIQWSIENDFILSSRQKIYHHHPLSL